MVNVTMAPHLSIGVRHLETKYLLLVEITDLWS